MRLQAQGIEFEQFLQMTGQSRDDAIGAMREQAETAAKLDLALRAIGEAERLEVTDTDLDEEFGRVAEQLERSVDDVRAEFTTAGQLPAVRSDLLKSKALDWVIDQAAVIDQDGSPVNAADLEVPDEEPPADESPAPSGGPASGPEPADDDSADTDDEGDEA